MFDTIPACVPNLVPYQVELYHAERFYHILFFNLDATYSTITPWQLHNNSTRTQLPQLPAPLTA